MLISIFDRVLLRSSLVGAVVLAGTFACSRPDGADSGGETGQPSVAGQTADTQATVTATTDTGVTASASDTAATSARTETTGAGQGVSGYRPMGRDTVQNNTGSQARTSDQTDTVTVGDSARVGKPGERLEGSQATEEANQDTLQEQSDTGRIRPPEDSAETSGARVGSSEMARDTSMVVAQGDTTLPADTGDQGTAADTAAVSVQVDTTTTAQASAPDTSTVEAGVDTTSTAQAQTSDTSAIQVSMDTATADQQTEVAVQDQAGAETAVVDTAVVVGDSAAAAKTGERLEPEAATAEANADTLATDVDRIRPPEDSTEILGNVTTEQADPETGDVESRDAAPTAAAGIPSTGNAVTGANAVAQITRQGQSCSVVADSDDVRWDMSLSPATLNPCGAGTMTLPKAVTGGAAGQ
ncbi:MAG TPA: hypothetical protein VHH32_08395 [Gemmatimonadales bacterium]|nr:hypothetical protein [Gemmatimonadales bacterium]